MSVVEWCKLHNYDVQTFPMKGFIRDTDPDEKHSDEEWPEYYGDWFGC